MIKFLWTFNEEEMPLELSLTAENINREIKAIRDPQRELHQSLIFSTFLTTDDINNPLFEVFNFNKQHKSFRLNIQILEKENILEEYVFNPTPQVEYSERFDHNALQYITKLTFRETDGGNLNANSN